MGKKMTLAELISRTDARRAAEAAEQAAWEATAEGAAWRRDHDALQARLREADERFAVENPPPDDDDDECQGG